MTMEPIELDALDAVPSKITVDVRLRIKNRFRIRIGGWLLAIASRVLRSEVAARPVVPPLLVFPNRMLTEAGRLNLLANWREYVESPDVEKRLAILDFPATTYQLIDGVWYPLHPGDRSAYESHS
jgi:hypothetical protein